jgi:tRNA threonylcarbamoyladenosine modification (KEOPS) complex  Pcc1 subunit
MQRKTMIILFEETNLFINFRATSSGSNCSKNIYTTTDFNKYVSPVYDSVLPETNETDNVSPVYDSVLPETNETDNKSSRASCVIPSDT